MKYEDIVNISSPDFPGMYPDNSDVTWLIESESTSGSFVIQFHHFVTEHDFDYHANDNLTVGYGMNISEETVLFRFSSFISPDTAVVIQESEIWIRFLSNELKFFSGFSATVTCIKDNGKRVNLSFFFK